MHCGKAVQVIIAKTNSMGNQMQCTDVDNQCVSNIIDIFCDVCI